jgi:hypothetical protein
MMQVRRLEAEDTVMGRIQRKRLTSLTSLLENGVDQTGKRQKRMAHHLEDDLDGTWKKQKRLPHECEAVIVQKAKKLAHQLEADLVQKVEKQKTLAHQLEADLDPTLEKQRRVAHKSEADLDPNDEKLKGLTRQLEADLNEVAGKQRKRQTRQLKVQKRLHQKSLPNWSEVDLNLSGGRRHRPLVSLKDKEEDLFPSSLVPFKTFLDQPDTETDSDIR